MDKVIIHLNTSVENLAAWLLTRYGRGNLPLDVEPWQLYALDVRGECGMARVEIEAIPPPPDGAGGPIVEPRPALALSFRISDIGTERDARVEVEARCLSREAPLRTHFYQVLAHIAYVWPEALRDLERALLAPATGEEAGLLAAPWLRIPDAGWDRLAVELLHKGCTSGEIARRTGKGIVAKTVDNRLSQLRAQYGPEVVPPRLPARKSGRKSGIPGY